MGKGSAPAAPDPYQSAAAQYQYGTQAASYNAALNNVNTSGPTSSTNYSITGHDPTTGAPIYTQSTQLNAPTQALLTGQQGLQSGAQGLAAGQESELGSNLWQLPTQSQNGQFGQEAQTAAFNQAKATLDPQWSQQQESLDASLRNSGAQPGTPAYDNAMQAFQANKTAAYNSAENQAFNQGLSAQGQQIQDINTANAGQLGNLSSLFALGAAPGTTNPSGSGGGGGGSSGSSVSAPNIMQAFQNQYQGQLAGYNANVSSSNADTGALAAIAAAAISYY